MAQTSMSELVRAALDGLRDFLDSNTHVGTPIETLQGDTILPISRIHVGFATGGVDYAAKKSAPSQNFGGGTGGGVSVTPMAFFILRRDGSTALIPVTQSPIDTSLAKIASAAEHVPALIKRIKKAFF